MNWRLVIFTLCLCWFNWGYAALTPADYQQLKKGYDLLNTQPQQAIEILQRVNQRIPDSQPKVKANVGHMLVQAYQQLHQYNQAINQLNQVQKLLTSQDPLYAQGEVLLAYLYYQQQQYSSCSHHAEQALSQAVAIEVAQRAKIAALQANCLYQQKKLSQASQAINQANQWDSYRTQEWLHFAVSLHYQLQQYPLAIELLERHLLLMVPENSQYWLMLITSYQQQKQYRQALASMEAMPPSLLQQKNIRRQKIQLYLFNQQPYQAARLQQQAIEQSIFPDDYSHRRYLADLYIQARDRSAAAQQLQLISQRQWLKDPQKQQQLYLQQAWLAQQRQQWPSVQRFLTQAQEVGEPLTKQWQIILAVSFIQQQQWQQAQHILQPLAAASDPQASNLARFIQYVIQ